MLFRISDLSCLRVLLFFESRSILSLSFCLFIFVAAFEISSLPFFCWIKAGPFRKGQWTQWGLPLLLFTYRDSIGKGCWFVGVVGFLRCIVTADLGVSQVWRSVTVVSDVSLEFLGPWICYVPKKKGTGFPNTIHDQKATENLCATRDQPPASLTSCGLGCWVSQLG